MPGRVSTFWRVGGLCMSKFENWWILQLYMMQRPRCHFRLSCKDSDSANMRWSDSQNDARKWKRVVRSTLLLFGERGGPPGGFRLFDELVVSACLNLKTHEYCNCEWCNAQDAILDYHAKMQILQICCDLIVKMMFANWRQWCEALSFFLESEAASGRVSTFWRVGGLCVSKFENWWILQL